MNLYCPDCCELLLDGSCAHCFAESAKAVQFPKRANFIGAHAGHDRFVNKAFRDRLDAVCLRLVIPTPASCNEITADTKKQLLHHLEDRLMNLGPIMNRSSQEPRHGKRKRSTP